LRAVQITLPSPVFSFAESVHPLDLCPRVRWNFCPFSPSSLAVLWGAAVDIRKSVPPTRLPLFSISLILSPPHFCSIEVWMMPCHNFHCFYTPLSMALLPSPYPPFLTCQRIKARPFSYASAPLPVFLTPILLRIDPGFFSITLRIFFSHEFSSVPRSPAFFFFLF